MRAAAVLDVHERIPDRKDNSKLFIVCKKGNSFVPLKVQELMLFQSVCRTSFAIDARNNRYLVNRSLNDLDEVLSRDIFFRVNRKIILNIHAIREFRMMEFGKVAIWLKSTEWLSQDFIMVSQVTTPYFREWINSL